MIEKINTLSSSKQINLILLANKINEIIDKLNEEDKCDDSTQL